MKTHENFEFVADAYIVQTFLKNSPLSRSDDTLQARSEKNKIDSNEIQR